MPRKSANPIDVHVGSRVRMRRMMVGLSQEKLGEALGLTFQQVQKYEKGLNRIGASRLYQIARILVVPVSYFYDGLDLPDGDLPAPQAGAGQLDLERMTTGEGIQLNSAFFAIRDADLRRRLLDLVKVLGRQPSPSDK
ncbi:MAG: helix-turn-helix domain-containing protein [Rhizobiales bacterium]|nr:helix-turn-helix domain-containing protein [Hyphomicrobiales bacterium]